MDASQAIADAGCDYLRLTIPPGNPGFSEALAVFQEGIQTDADKGHIAKICHLQGYHGTICGGYFCGLRADGMMCQVSGADSNSVIHKLRGVELECNVPRCDVQVTLNARKTQIPTAAKLRIKLRDAERRDPRKVHRNTALYETKKKADTLYIGARSSDAFLRFYNASAVHPESYPADHYRFEKQAGKRTAETIFSSLRRSDSLTHCATSFVIGHLMSIGLTFDWFGDEVPIMPANQYRKTDADRKLDWMAGPVCATFWWLIKRGHVRELERRLHLAPGTLPDGAGHEQSDEEVTQE